MSIISEGIADSDVKELGALVYTPGEIKQEAVTTQNEISQLTTDVVNSKLDTKTRKAFQMFVDEWVNFYKNHTSWFDRLWFANLEKIREFRQRAAKWREQLSGQGVAMTAPKPELSPLGVTVNWKKLLLIGGGTLIGVGGILYLWKSRNET